jgi:hypothetical protein
VPIRRRPSPCSKAISRRQAHPSPGPDDSSHGRPEEQAPARCTSCRLDSEFEIVAICDLSFGVWQRSGGSTLGRLTHHDPMKPRPVRWLQKASITSGATISTVTPRTASAALAIVCMALSSSKRQGERAAERQRWTGDYFAGSRADRPHNNSAKPHGAALLPQTQGRDILVLGSPRRM